MKFVIRTRHGNEWRDSAEFRGIELWPQLEERERGRVSRYDAEREAAKQRRKAEQENRRLAQRVALERKEVPPGDLEDDEFETFVPSELTVDQRAPRLRYQAQEFCQLCDPGSYLMLVGTTALALVQNRWADEVLIEVES